MYRQTERGYSMAFWAVFIAFVAVPMMSLLWDASRYMDIRGELQMAADAAAVAAAQEVDIPYFESTGIVRIGAGATGAAYNTAAAHFVKLNSMGYMPKISYINVNQQNHTVHVGASATTRIFIGISPHVTISVDGVAQTRMTAQ